MATVKSKKAKAVRKPKAEAKKPAPKAKAAPKKSVAPKAAKPALMGKTSKIKARPTPKAIKPVHAAPSVAPKPVVRKPGSLRERQLDGIKKKLASQREAILCEAEVAMNSLPDQTIFPDLGDQASVESDRSFMLRLRGREQRLLKKIEEAIDRIEKGTFGMCEVCGEEISVSRLEARPVTTMCINCKTEQEAEEKLKGE